MLLAFPTGAVMVKAALETSWPVLPAASEATTFTTALVVGVLGTVQANDPELVRPLAIVVNDPPPSVEYARSTAVTPTLSVAVQVMLWIVPAVQVSPPLGA